MKKVKKFLSKYGIHAFLLPAFFVLHSYMQYYGLVSSAVAWKVFAEITGLALLFFLLLRSITKNISRSFQITTLTGFVLLFYGAIKDFLGNVPALRFATAYSILLPLVLVIGLVLLMTILRKKDFSSVNLFQNTLLLLFVLVDLINVWLVQNEVFINRNLLVEKNIVKNISIAAPAGKPDVYYLVFDCYPGSKFLLDYMKYNNGALDSALQNKGFRVIGNPKSNYNRTAFSIASVLNFEYLKGITNSTRIQALHYSHALLTVNHAATPELFTKLGYKIYNLSIFELANQQPVYKENFLTAPEEDILLYNTLPERIKNDILWHFPFFTQFNSQEKTDRLAGAMGKRDFNKLVADSMAKIPLETSGNSKFVYAHFYLPHPPFYYDANGKSNGPNVILDRKSFFKGQLFLSYLQYTNQVMLKMIDTILSNSARPPVIIIQSDHGFTDFEDCPNIPYLHFKNYTAFYFPDKNYSSLYDTLSNINTFPIIFNKYFNTHIAMQKDTSTFLRY